MLDYRPKPVIFLITLTVHKIYLSRFSTELILLIQTATIFIFIFWFCEV